ncbi:MAG: Tim44 domain-containing protein [Boseongicola sp. SB0664_bin_43]|uniref:Tim44 domain-containing protein n=1 Tax=Boseongicola sp. SB0664_bin_43 TaxID=2604844 RepID=A0A6B0Y3Q7_9RHOB|nr:Tim44 domain-containing protein [Boseongicola sp. SB0664_bin_43]
MSSSIFQLLVLAGVALFLIFKLRSVLGTRGGFEKPPIVGGSSRARPEFDVIEGGPDPDITDFVEDGSTSAKALAAMKEAEPGFMVATFLEGAREAFEMILMAFENGDLSEVEGLISDDIERSFAPIFVARRERRVTVEASLVAIRDVTLKEAAFDADSSLAEMTVRFVCELTSVVKDDVGKVVEGDPNEIKRQKHVWTFARTMGANDPNWQLVATTE